MCVLSFTIAQQFTIIAVLTFAFAQWHNRVILWCVFPLITYVLNKYCTFAYNKRECVYNSSWLLVVVKIVSFTQHTVSRLVGQNQNAQLAPIDKHRQDRNSVWKQSDKLLELTTRDFIKGWFMYISDNESTVQELSEVLQQLRRHLFIRLANVDKYVLLKDYVNLYQCHLKVMKHAEAYVRKQPNIRHKKHRDKEFKTLQTVTDVLWKTHQIHTALKSAEFDIWHLQSVFDVCFSDLLDLKLYNAELPRTAIRDIVVKSVLQPFMDFLSQPYWLHFIIIKLTSDEDIKLCNENAKPNIQEDTEQIPVPSDSESYCSTLANVSSSTTVSNNNEAEKEDIVYETLHYTKQSAQMDREADRPLFDLGDSTDGNLEEDSLEVEVAEDVSLHISSNLEKPSNIFVELSVIDTEKVEEQRSSSAYTVYSIKYLAWHQNEEGGWNIREGFAKRRFREFSTLHERLEDHPILKQHLKGIRGPSKWMTFPFSNLDEDTIKKRKAQLESYMKTIISESELSNSLAVREFLAYEGDTSIAYVRRPSEIYKINQMMINTVKRVKSNVIDKLKPRSGEFVPSAASYSSLPNTTDMWTDGLDPDALTVTPVIQQERHEIEAALEWALADFEEQMQDSYGENEDQEGFFDVLDTSFRGAPQKNSDVGAIDREVPIASSLLDLALQTVSERDCWVRDEVAVRLAKLAIGKFLELFVQSELDMAFTPERCTYYLELITETLWPGGVLDTSVYTPSPEQCKLTRAQARSCLQQFFPGFLPHIIGRETFEYSVDQVMDSLDDVTLNKHFAYQLLDLMLVHLCPSVNSASRQTQLLNTNDMHTAQAAESTSQSTTLY